MYNLYNIIGVVLLCFALPTQIGGYEIFRWLKGETEGIEPSGEGLSFRSILYNVAFILIWPLMLPVFYKLNKHKF